MPGCQGEEQSLTLLVTFAPRGHRVLLVPGQNQSACGQQEGPSSAQVIFQRLHKAKGVMFMSTDVNRFLKLHVITLDLQQADRGAGISNTSLSPRLFL